MLPAMSCFTGMTKEEIFEDPQFTAQEWKIIHDKVNMFDAQGVSIEQIDSYCELRKPDILVVDQLDKVHVSGNFSRTDEKLREIYTQAREIAKRHNLALIAISQASADAEGKTRLNPSEMEGSKTGKFAEADMIIGIGKHDQSGVDDEPDYTRHLTVGKNKITGWHGTVICEIQPKLSRYID
jgi:replicative DNA helicase